MEFWILQPKMKILVLACTAFLAVMAGMEGMVECVLWGERSLLMQFSIKVTPVEVFVRGLIWL